jgi:hypothetical protein
MCRFVSVSVNVLVALYMLTDPTEKRHGRSRKKTG